MKKLLKTEGDKIGVIVFFIIVLAVLLWLFGPTDAHARGEHEIEWSWVTDYSDGFLGENTHSIIQYTYNFTDGFGVSPISHMSQVKEGDDYNYTGYAIHWRYQFGRRVCR